MVKMKIEFELKELEKLDIQGCFTVNGKPFSRLTLAGIKSAIKRGCWI